MNFLQDKTSSHAHYKCDKYINVWEECGHILHFVKCVEQLSVAKNFLVNFVKLIPKVWAKVVQVGCSNNRNST